MVSRTSPFRVAPPRMVLLAVVSATIGCTARALEGSEPGFPRLGKTAVDANHHDTGGKGRAAYRSEPVPFDPRRAWDAAFVSTRLAKGDDWPAIADACFPDGVKAGSLIPRLFARRRHQDLGETHCIGVFTDPLREGEMGVHIAAVGVERTVLSTEAGAHLPMSLEAVLRDLDTAAAAISLDELQVAVDRHQGGYEVALIEKSYWTAQCGVRSEAPDATGELYRSMVIATAHVAIGEVLGSTLYDTWTKTFKVGRLVDLLARFMGQGDMYGFADETVTAELLAELGNRLEEFERWSAEGGEECDVRV